MAKDKLTDYDSTASGNLDVGGISVAEGMLPSGVNNAIREQMSHLADFAAGTSGVDVLKLQDDTDTNSIKLQAPASVTATTTFTLPDGDGASGQTMITDGAGTLSWAAPYGNRNLIINGAMTIDQRNSGAVVSAEGYLVDRWRVWRNETYDIQQSTDVPTGFSNSLKVTKTSTTQSTYAYLVHYVEGFNFAHTLFGTANAKTITLSFWVKSSVTGTFSGGLINSAGNRTYPATYTVSVSNTWEYKTITIAGDTSGTWVGSTNGIGVGVWFNFGGNGSGTANAWNAADATGGVTGNANLGTTNGATFYITGVQLEVGTATPFEHRSFGDELARCQRYYFRWTAGDNNSPFCGGAFNNGTSNSDGVFTFPVRMRIAPTALEQSGTASDYRIIGSVGNCTSVPTFLSANVDNIRVRFVNASSLTSGNCSTLAAGSTTGANAFLGWGAEL